MLQTPSLISSPTSKTRAFASNLSNLPGYLKSVADTPFEWGVHDCLTFTNGAWRSIWGYGWADDWLGRYMIDGKAMNQTQLQQEFGFERFSEAVDSKLTRFNGIPPRGSLVATKKVRRWVIGNALGISVGLKAAFVTTRGISYHPIETIDKAWVQT
ncbi:MAG: hypothetical protein GY766_05520 [Herbaspirillum sp.]|nr:hypothetical protein [Herbaspirillum sp.]